tara:strand:+ start:1003 stop:1482 length:480 start_codon:yes stop_codon:yes gene_type:complete
MDLDKRDIIQRVPNGKRRVIIRKTSNIGKYTINIRFPLKNIVNIKLIKATFSHKEESIDNDYITLHIDNLSRIESENRSNIFENSFAVLDFNKNLKNSANENIYIYSNTYEENNDIVYYCPPISLSSFKIKLYDGDNIVNYINTFKLELEVERLSDRRT